MEIHKAKRLLKVRVSLSPSPCYIWKYFPWLNRGILFLEQEQEQALVDAIAMLEDISDSENGNK